VCGVSAPSLLKLLRSVRLVLVFAEIEWFPMRWVGIIARAEQLGVPIPVKLDLPDDKRGDGNQHQTDLEHVKEPSEHNKRPRSEMEPTSIAA